MIGNRESSVRIVADSAPIESIVTELKGKAKIAYDYILRNPQQTNNRELARILNCDEATIRKARKHII